jgi:integrase
MPCGAAAVRKTDNRRERFLMGEVRLRPLSRNEAWPNVIEKARLPGITPHTMRHTLGSTVGAILGHKTARATGIYAHIQTTPAQRVADRVSRTIAAALEGKPRCKIRPIRRKEGQP